MLRKTAPYGPPGMASQVRPGIAKVGSKDTKANPFFCMDIGFCCLIVFRILLFSVTSQGCNWLRLRKNNFPECVFGLNIIFELFPFVDITHTSYYISIDFNFFF